MSVPLIVPPAPKSSIASEQRSLGGLSRSTQASYAQLELQICMPLPPPGSVHGTASPARHSKPSSVEPSQSSSSSLHSSAGGTHAPHWHVPSQVWMPYVPHEAVHHRVAPRAHTKTSSGSPSPLSS